MLGMSARSGSRSEGRSHHDDNNLSVATATKHTVRQAKTTPGNPQHPEGVVEIASSRSHEWASGHTQWFAGGDVERCSVGRAILTAKHTHYMTCAIGLIHHFCPPCSKCMW